MDPRQPQQQVEGVSLRPGGEGDRNFVIEMARQACIIEDRPLPPANAPEVLEMLPASGDGVVIAVASGEKRVGAAWWHFHNPILLRSDDGSPLPEMIVAVEGNTRGQGVGTMLINAIAVRAEGEFPALSLNVHLRNPAARLYTRTGFHVAGRGRGWFGVAMERRFADGLD